MPIFKRAAIVAALALATTSAQAATCGNTSAGFNAWKASFAADAKKAGVKKRGLAALASASYASKTIAADRNQKSFKYSLSKFMQVRGADTIVAQGKKRKAQNANLFAALEKRYGVPAGVIIAIHGMETGFGGFMGSSPVVSAITTLTYDCRRSEFFKTARDWRAETGRPRRNYRQHQRCQTRRIGPHAIPARQRAAIRCRRQRRRPR